MSALKFIPETHKYISLDDSNVQWISATSFISYFKQAFDSNKIAEKVSKSKKSKWYNMSVQDIQEAWKSEANRATSLGTWYHKEREKDICGFTTMERSGVTVPVIKPLEEESGIKYSPNQKLEEGIYPEHMMYLKSAGICGQSDLVEVVNGMVHITDYKTNKEIKTEGFTSWDGLRQKMSGPLSHLDDCNLNHYAVQLSLYLYMILKHNPKLKPGNLILHHVLFDTMGVDKFGNPITALDTNGDPIVLDIVQYELPYLKKEVINILHWLEDNRKTLKYK